jgi:thymidylate synthase ThyX
VVARHTRRPTARETKQSARWSRGVQNSFSEQNKFLESARSALVADKKLSFFFTLKTLGETNAEIEKQSCHPA